MTRSSADVDPKVELIRRKRGAAPSASEIGEQRRALEAVVYSAEPELAAPSEQMPPGAVDIAVAHPATTFFRGRPQWRIEAGAIAVELPEKLGSNNQRTLIEARYESEPPDAIPLDRLMLWPGERLPLLLRPGRIRILQGFEDGRTPVTFVVNVE